MQQLGNLVARQILTGFFVNTSYPVYYVSFVFSDIYAHTHCVFAGIRSVLFNASKNMTYLQERVPFSVQR